MVRRCAYFGCKSTWGVSKPMFRFPTKRPKLLEIWIRNCGKERFSSDAKETIRNRYICIDHFDSKYINHNNAQRKHLTPTAVPTPYIDFSSKAVTESLHGSEPQGFRPTKMNEAEKKRLIGPAVRYGIYQDCMTKRVWNKDKTLEIGGLTSQPEEDHQDPDLMVLKPNKVYHNYHKQICVELAKEPDHSNARVVENKCMECDRPVHGFQWWCLQCSGIRCGKCAVRMRHRPHHILRAPANSTREETEAVLEAIREHMSEDFFVRQAIIRHVDENGVDLIVTDEPEVKAEPLEIEDDAYDPLACNPAVENVPLVCNPAAEKDPLACNSAEDDPLAEFKPEVQDIPLNERNPPLEEPSIDYQPKSLSLNIEFSAVDQPSQNSTQRRLGVEIYSPVHPGLEAFELSLAQCSGIDDFMLSERIPIDSQSMDHSEGQNYSQDFGDSQSCDDDHRPPSIQQARVPTRFTYGEDNSEDVEEQIDYDQPFNSYIDTDTEQDGNQTRRPWVQVMSSQEQNITVSTIQHKTQQKRLVVQPPPNKEQNILAKQQNIQTKRPWVQVFSNIGQKSTEAKQKNQNRSEQSDIEDICEEQTSTVTEKQDKHNMFGLQQSEIQGSNEEQIPTDMVNRNSVREKQSSTTTAKRKRKIIIIKKRANAQYSTIIQREFTEPSDDNNDIDNNIQGARETNTLDKNMTTEPTNTLFNLDDKKIITVKKRPRTKYATHIQRDFTEPSDDNDDIDNNVQCARDTDTLNISMTTEATNTLLNLDDFIRDRVLEYPPDIEELM